MLLSKFLTSAGKLKNKYQSRLPTNTQRKVAKCVKHARNMGLFPFIGVLKPTDQLPLKGFHRDLEEMNRKAIDPFTGRLFLHRMQAAADVGEYVEHPGEELAEGAEVEEEVEELRQLALDDVPEVPSRR